MLNNRPFLRATHGLALTLWRTRRYREAETVLLNMLWLNPGDNQGARFVRRTCAPADAGKTAPTTDIQIHCGGEKPA